jgi:integrase/recombinase XerD
MDLARKRLTTNRKVSPHNRLKILEFLDYLETREISLPRRIRYLQNMSKLAAMLHVNFSQATKSQIETVVLNHGRLDLADETKTQFKIMVKRFYRWLKDPDDEEYPPEVKWIKTASRSDPLPLPEDVLSEKGVEALLSVAEYSRDKAFIAMLFDLGTRIGEFLTLQRKSIVFDEKGAVVVVDGKMGQRRQRLILSVPFVAEWLNDHPDKTPEAPLWIHHAQGCHEDGPVALDYYAARKLLMRLQRKAGIQKPLNPHAFRHARATHLANFLTEAQLKHIFGWTQNSRMPCPSQENYESPIQNEVSRYIVDSTCNCIGCPRFVSITHNVEEEIDDYSSYNPCWNDNKYYRRTAWKKARYYPAHELCNGSCTGLTDDLPC